MQYPCYWMSILISIQHLITKTIKCNDNDWLIAHPYLYYSFTMQFKNFIPKRIEKLLNLIWLTTEFLLHFVCSTTRPNSDTSSLNLIRFNLLRYYLFVLSLSAGHSPLSHHTTPHDILLSITIKLQKFNYKTCNSMLSNRMHARILLLTAKFMQL